MSARLKVVCDCGKPFRVGVNVTQPTGRLIMVAPTCDCYPHPSAIALREMRSPDINALAFLVDMANGDGDGV